MEAYVGIRIQFLAVLASICLVLGVVFLIRRRSLRAEYSILWLVGTGCLLLMSLWRGLLDRVALMVGVYYAPAVLLLVIIFFGVLAFLHLSIVLSRQADCNKTLVQEIALLKQKIKMLEEK